MQPKGWLFQAEIFQLDSKYFWLSREAHYLLLATPKDQRFFFKPLTPGPKVLSLHFWDVLHSSSQQS